MPPRPISRPPRPPGTTLTTKRQTRVGREPDAGTTHATSPTDTEQPRIATNTAGTTRPTRPGTTDPAGAAIPAEQAATTT
ncbi:hypothetical protein OSI85_25550, partial [Mycobacterium ulcerans]